MFLFFATRAIFFSTTKTQRLKVAQRKEEGKGKKENNKNA